MNRSLIGLFATGIAFSIYAAQPTQNEGWKADKQSGGGITIYSRPHPGSHLKEFKAVGEIDAPTRTVP